ncbi:acyltransferase family protein [Staphylococcus shinii]|uniref:acyltransferase family protein n=1 Tax=Staphylococcus shinii TaxID=2912228 RepID=UPI00384E6465
MNRSSVLYFISSLTKNKKGVPLLLTYAISTILTIFWQLNYEQFSIDIPVIGTFIMSRAFIFNWISYFILGIIFAKYYEEINKAIRKYKTLLLPSIVVMFISFLIFIDLDHFVTSSHPMFLLYTPFFLAFLIYFYYLIRKSKSIMQILTLIGNYSMGIYLVHPLVKWIVMKIPIFDNRDSLLLYGILFIIIVSISVLIINLLIKIPNGNYIVPVPKRSKFVSNQINYSNREATD